MYVYLYTYICINTVLYLNLKEWMIKQLNIIHELLKFLVTGSNYKYSATGNFAGHLRE